MEIRLSLELHTEMRYGGNRGTIIMFAKTVILTHITGKQLEEGFEDHYIQIDHWNFRPSKLNIVNNERCICTGFATASISKKSDSIEYYRDLTKRDWVPHRENMKAVQCDGYPNFEPEKF